MAPKSPWYKKATITNNTKTEPTEFSAIDYGEAQTDEIEALKAIYMEDFEEVETKSAWSKTADRSFKLKLRSFSDSTSFVTLTVRLTATYPKTLPLLDIVGLTAYHERTQTAISKILKNKPKEMLGDVMIHALASEIQDALEDAVQARQQGVLPSLEDERATAEEVANAFAKQVEEAEERRRQEARLEEQRLLTEMVDEEIGRRERRTLSRTVSDFKPLPRSEVVDTVTFDQPATVMVNDELVQFNSLHIITTLSQSRSEETLLAKAQIQYGTATPLMVVKRLSVKKQRDEVVELEAMLDIVSTLHHDNIQRLLTFRMERIDASTSRLVVCHEYIVRGNLETVLKLGALHVDKARQFTIELLEALEYLHRNGVSHGSVCPANIAVTEDGVSPKLCNIGYGTLSQALDAIPAKWQAPETDHTSNSTLRQMKDIWDFGITVAQMLFGYSFLEEYKSPSLMLSKYKLSESLEDFLRKMLTVDARKRPTAFDLLTSEFLRSHDAPLSSSYRTSYLSRSLDTTGNMNQLARRSRHDSSSAMESTSRYENDFTELGRLGKGGFGEVVKSRNKLDGGIYAIKKIKQAPQLLDQVIAEVMLLNRLNHPYVVRYFSTWLEVDVSTTFADASTTMTDTTTEGHVPIDELRTEDDTSSESMAFDFEYQSVGGLDFVSSNGFPAIEFGEDSEDDLRDHENPFQNYDDSINKIERHGNVDTSQPSSNDPLQLRHSHSEQRRLPSILYIQMEYCERRTLRDLVRKGMSTDEAWRYARNITEGLAHIHGHGIIHRDLKPDNIFIDLAGNPKIGDFGLATTSRTFTAERRPATNNNTGSEMTQMVGTTLYVAPELKTSSDIRYTEKVDMYSLGVIFFEMCLPFNTAMERIRVLQEIREEHHQLPTIFQPGKEKAAQGRLISCLISHKPSDRPSSTELLRSDILPLKIEDETIRQALSGLSDPTSPYHQKMMSALFKHDSAAKSRVKVLAWDARASNIVDDANRLRLRAIAGDTFKAVFKRHGAEEGRRETIFPKSPYNTNNNIVQMLDASGNLLQLPYDLTIPYARQLARQNSDLRCTYVFGNAYRDTFSGGPPRINEEVDFDIVNDKADTEQTFNDAEVLKVTDEIINDLPFFATASSVHFHLNHTHILRAVLDHCCVPTAQQPAVKEILSRLGFNQFQWPKVRGELRKFGLPDTTLDDLQQFDFRAEPGKAFEKLTLLLQSNSARTRVSLDAAVQSLNDIVTRARGLGVQRTIYVVPLSSVKAAFYEDGMLFQCVLERKSNRAVVAAGGRYDSLIRAQRANDIRANHQGAVGVAFSLDFIISNMASNSQPANKKTFLKHDVSDEIPPKRCDVAVVTSGGEDTQDTAARILANLWSNNVSAELLTHSRASREKEYNFTVAIRHAASNSVKVTNIAGDTEGVDVPVVGLVSHVQQELRERESTKLRQQHQHRQMNQSGTERKSNVQVLLARHGSKKSNKYQIVNDAQQRWTRRLDAAREGPILAVETRDDILVMIEQNTKLSDAESWRKVVQNAQVNDRQYIRDIHEVLQGWRNQWEQGDGVRDACIFNFRSQYCVAYDLGL